MLRTLLFSLVLLASTASTALASDWSVYASYHNPTRCVALGNRIYVLANGDLYSYDTQDQSIQTYDKANLLSDFEIFDIQPSSHTNELAIVYTNGNVDLLSADGDVYNISELKAKTLPDKTINEALSDGNSLYISTNSGLAELDLSRRIYKNLYNVGYSVKGICLYDGYILAATNGGVFRAEPTANLLDPANWQKVGSATGFSRLLKAGSQLYALSSIIYKITSVSPFRITQVGDDRVAGSFAYGDYIYYVTTTGQMRALDKDGNVTTPTTPYPVYALADKGGTLWAACGPNGLVGMTLDSDNTFTQKVGDITPDSPIRNTFYSLDMVGERLLATGGNFYYPNIDCTGTVMKYEAGRWHTFDEAGPAAAVQAGAYTNAVSIAQDPADSEHHWVATRSSGLYEFRNCKYSAHYSSDNSPLTSILPQSQAYYKYVWVSALAFDSQRNLWMCNNQCDTILRILKPNGSWLKYYYDDIAGYPTFDHVVFDRRGWAWINSRRTTVNSAAGILVINTNGTIDTQRDDTHRFHTTLTNQDGTSYTINELYDLTEDLDGNIWVGTEKGLFTCYEPEGIFNSGYRFTQIKISREDGSGLADYLLSGVPVTSIAIDGANRKWIGTGGSGLYLLSADGQQTLQRFTKDNSPLISDYINDICINGQTGEVFFATDKGLCSFMGDAVDAASELDKNNLWVYPNPKRPEDPDLVRVTGLSFNTDVKIANAAGRLVYEGTSNGGEFTWNCRTTAGKPVASGVYYILATDSDGKKGASAKVLVVR